MAYLLRKVSALAGFALFSAILLAPQAGFSADYAQSPACHCANFPQQCIIRTQNFISDFIIEKTAAPSQYEITGTSKYLGPLNTAHLKNVKLWFLIFKNNEVADKFIFRMGNLNSDFTFVFGRSFETKKSFDSVTLVYEINEMMVI